ncbi:GNAT family N-acetyltransferase [Oerskovia flava]|uniref:GNAT family N-acetyltransferase n=1 Tax=Oerskovia flava TaxID=2986422 RepID=UPI00223EBDAC|nr:GNAT family N-acetyltransferase [Oerskovia sp. JB1-3-2]
MSTASVVLHDVDWNDPEATHLREIQQVELSALYGVDLGTSDVGDTIEPSAVVATVLLRLGEQAAGCGTVRDVSGSPDGRGGVHPPATGEVKRVFVAPEHRGRGLSRALMAELERRASAAGLRTLVLETGTLQHEAIGLYLALGYLPIERYGAYAEEADSRCFAKELPVPVEVREVPWDDPDATALRREMSETSSQVLYPEVVEYLAARGGFEADDADLGREVLVAFVAYRDGEPVGTVALRRPEPGAPAGAAEVKKLFVVPRGRRSGAARELMAAAERAARERGLRRLLLETGIRQPAAITLYRSLGYRPVRPFPPYEGSTIALCFAKNLPNS